MMNYELNMKLCNSKLTREETVEVDNMFLALGKRLKELTDKYKPENAEPYHHLIETEMRAI